MLHVAAKVKSKILAAINSTNKVSIEDAEIFEKFLSLVMPF